MIKNVAVGHIAKRIRRRWFHTVKQAERYVATVLLKRDRAGVEAGLYYIDAPETKVNGKRKRP